MTMNTVTPHQASNLVAEGAMLIDIRGPDEHAREQIPGAVNVPLALVGELRAGGEPIIFHCRSGMRTQANATALRLAAKGAPCHILEGGIDAWRLAGLETRLDSQQPIEIMRQVQIIAGGLVLLGVMLGLLLAPPFALLSAFVGAGLMLAGATGWCGMATVLRRMPWNRRMLAA